MTVPLWAGASVRAGSQECRTWAGSSVQLMCLQGQDKGSNQLHSGQGLWEWCALDPTNVPVLALPRRYVRNTTARAFSVVASALGIPALLPFLKAVCQSKKSWQARHTGIKIVQQISILLGCAVLPHLKVRRPPALPCSGCLTGAQVPAQQGWICYAAARSSMSSGGARSLWSVCTGS